MLSAAFEDPTGDEPTGDEPTVDEPGSVLWIGPTEGAEFGPCFELLAEERAVEAVEGLEAVAALGEEATLFESAVLACPRPLVSTAAVQPLVELLGAGSVAQLLGTWCEGEGRTGHTIDGVERVFWHQWPAWWRRQHPEAGTNTAAAGMVWIHSADAEFARSLVATLNAEAAGAVWVPASGAVSPHAAVRNADVVLWDGTQLGGQEAMRLAAVCAEARAEKTPVVAMLDFPRTETVAAATALGVAGVLGKPFTCEALFDTLRQARTGVAASVASNRPEHACSGLLTISDDATRGPLPEAA